MLYFSAEIPEGAKGPGGEMGAAALEEAVSMGKHAQSTAVPREPRPPRCSRFSGSPIPPKAAPAPSPSSHLGGNPVKSILPGLLLHQLLKQRLALNNSGFQKVSLPFGMVSPTPHSSLVSPGSGGDGPGVARLHVARGPGWRNNICRNPSLAIRFCNCAGY